MDWLNILILALYAAGLIGVTYFTRKRSRTINDFLLAGKGVGGVMTAFAYGTTYFSAVIFIGYAGTSGYSYGLASLWIGVGNAIIGSFLAWQLFSKRTRRLMHYTGAKTMSEMLEKRYQSKHIKLLSALIIFVFLVPYAASVYQGLGYLFELVFHLPFWSVVLIMALLTSLYLFFGGYFATVVTDFIQGIIMLLGVVLMVGFVVNYETVGGLIESVGKLLGDNLGLFPAFVQDGKPLGYTLLMLTLLTSFGVWGLPQIVHKFHTVRSEKSVTSAKWISSGFALVVGVGAYFVGCLARYIIDVNSLLSQSGGADMIIPNVLYKALPAGLLGLIAVLILSASMSTLSALTLASGSSVAVDIYKGYIKKDASDKSVNLLMRVLCVIFILVSVVIALFKPEAIISLMSLSWGTIAGCFLAPYILGLFLKRMNKKAAYGGIITGLAVTAALYVTSLILPASNSAKAFLSAPAIGVYAMALNMLVTLIIAYLTKPMAHDFLQPLFKAMTQKESDGEPSPVAVGEQACNPVRDTDLDGESPKAAR